MSDNTQYKSWEAWTRKKEIPHDAYNGLDAAEEEFVRRCEAKEMFEDEFDIPIQDLIDAEIHQFEQRQHEERDKLGA